jgi:hypothetical protein
MFFIGSVKHFILLVTKNAHNGRRNKNNYTNNIKYLREKLSLPRILNQRKLWSKIIKMIRFYLKIHWLFLEFSCFFFWLNCLLKTLAKIMIWCSSSHSEGWIFFHVKNIWLINNKYFLRCVFWISSSFFKSKGNLIKFTT